MGDWSFFICSLTDANCQNISRCKVLAVRSGEWSRLAANSCQNLRPSRQILIGNRFEMALLKQRRLSCDYGPELMQLNGIEVAELTAIGSDEESRR